MWKYKLITDADTTVSNHPCIVKKIILYYADVTTAVIYNEKDDSVTATKRVWTLNSTAAIPKDEIDFGIQGADFYEGCYIDHALGKILVIYKD